MKAAPLSSALRPALRTSPNDQPSAHGLRKTSKHVQPKQVHSTSSMLRPEMTPTSEPFLRVSPAQTASGLPIVLLLGRHLPASTVHIPASVETVNTLLRDLPPGPFVLLYCQAGVGPTTLAGVRAFRAAYETVPRLLRERIAEIVCLQVSFALRAQIYASSGWMQCGEYAKLKYCDLIADLEQHLGVDALLAGLEDADVEYDAEMRTWLVRDDEIRRMPAPDPRKPLLDIDNIDFSRDDPSTPSPRYTAGQSAAGDLGGDRV